MRHVYILEITEKWHPLVAPGLAAGKRCFYVGETGHDPRERFKEHLTGKSTPGRKAKRPAKVIAKMRKHQGGTSLRRNDDLMFREVRARPYNKKPMITNGQSEAEERRAVLALRKAGHAVYPTGVGADVHAFGDYAATDEALLENFALPLKKSSS